MNLELSGKVALVTGASQGIGEAVARALAAEGADLHLVARDVARLERLRDDLTHSHGIRISIHAIDLTRHDSIIELDRQIDSLDILVNNAGAIPGGTLFELSEEKWRAGWELKVFGYINMCRVFYPRLKARGGVIVNNIGNGGEVYDPTYIAGVTGNAALMAFTRALGGASSQDNIRVVGINPGPVGTDRIQRLLETKAEVMFGDKSRYNELAANYPFGRPAHTAEIADLICFLASPRSSYTSGSIITIDGGISSKRSIV